MELFQEFVLNSNLIDLDLKGNHFTWFSNPRQGVIIREKLDRALVNLPWLTTYPHVIAIAYPAISSDHSPILLDVNLISSDSSFKYEAFWDDHEECKGSVAEGWNQEDSVEAGWSKFRKNSRNCSRSLQRWHQKTFLNAKKELPKLKQKLKHIHNSERCSDSWEEVKELRKKISDLWKQEEKFWGAEVATSKASGGLGFRDFMTMNQAHLAMQAWRIWKNPESLCAKILKGFYYLNHEFESAKKGTSPSWMWSSILEGRDLLLRHGRWQMGPGDQIKAGKYNWVAAGLSLQHHLIGDDFLVSELMFPNQRAWDPGKVRQAFPSEIAIHILQTPISWSLNQDKFFWPHTKDGRYSVKSGYYVASKDTLNPSRPSPSHRNPKEFWNGIWGIRGESTVGEIEAIVTDVAYLQPSFARCGFTWVKREGNECANFVARSCLRGSLPPNWVIRPPPQLRALLSKDLQSSLV
ncbi:Endonuclease/exonuclease/phosphatase superfamily [Sesbania bispinosa]|nr:Endonuclease/exonuclease/phosphatase superfamily [Sesbania bispinosa]